MNDYEEKYVEFWKDIIEDEDGNINKDQMMRELFDFANLMSNVGKVYDHVTGGKVSKPLTDPSIVNSLADDNYADIYADEVEWVEPV